MKIKYFFILVIFLNLMFVVSAQSNLEKTTYKLIQDVISKDTIVSKIKKRVVTDNFIKNKITVADTIKYFSSIRNQKLYLSKEEENLWLKYFLEEAKGKNDHKILNIISKKELDTVISEINKTEKKIFSHIFENIEIIKKPQKNKPIHYFSAAFKIRDNTHLIFHSKYSSPLNSYGELIIFKILENGGYHIEKSVILLIS